MKKNCIKFIVTVLLFILLIVSIFSYFNFYKNSQELYLKTNPHSIILDKVGFKTETKIQTKTNSQANSSVDSKSTNIKVSLIVLDKTYSIEVLENSSVFDAMKTLEEENLKDSSFSFKYTEHLGLGAFISEINGVEGSPGKYWIYYINNIKASVGVSKYILQNSDIISWKQESF